jgi:alpha,alpha-trehalose-phosphate synthase [UDP-forming]
MDAIAIALERATRANGASWMALAAGRVDQEMTLGGTGTPCTVRTVRLKARDAFQAGFGNQVLWPLCHMFPSRCVFQATVWAAYREANGRLATAARACVGPGDIVWVNDFHLALVPGLLRAAGASARIGIFWHLPFPPPALFGVCPWRTELLGGLLGADVVGVQTEEDATNFLACVRRFLDLPASDDPPEVRLPGRTVRVATLPVGVDAEWLATRAADPDVQGDVERLRAGLGAPLVVLGVDRLDHAKGINERLLGFERFLERHADWRRRVALIQITVPSQFRVPDARALKRTVEESVGRIVGRFTYEGRAPLAYLYTALDPERLAVYYSAADVALVTPLRDGMNLVAKEYVACHGDGSGVLVLSEFAGAARELHDALLVNPYDPESIRRQLHAAVTMAPEERRRRMEAIAGRVAAHDVHWWTSRFLDLLSAA